MWHPLFWSVSSDSLSHLKKNYSIFLIFIYLSIYFFIYFCMFKPFHSLMHQPLFHAFNINFLTGTNEHTELWSWLGSYCFSAMVLLLCVELSCYLLHVSQLQGYSNIRKGLLFYPLPLLSKFLSYWSICSEVPAKAVYLGTLCDKQNT